MTDAHIADLLDRRKELTEGIIASPYDAILYLQRAAVYSDLKYPDLTAGDAYRALLLVDEAQDESGEFHEQAREALEEYSAPPYPEVLRHGDLTEEICAALDERHRSEGKPEPYEVLAALASTRCFQILSESLLRCGCLRSAYTFCKRGCDALPSNQDLLRTKESIEEKARQRLGIDAAEEINVNHLPDGGLARREVYPWNTLEPDRFSDETLSYLSKQLETIAPKCSVQISALPDIPGWKGVAASSETLPTWNQLGLFAKEDIGPGETVLQEYTLLTANNRLHHSTCDACGAELPPLGADSSAVNCPDCYDTVFCDEFCFEQAQENYHPAVCETDVDSIAKDPDPANIERSLYLLLLRRLLALSVHQDIHPLDAKEIKYIWGDFVPPSANNAVNPPEGTLPFSFIYNVEFPLHILEKMDIDIYATFPRYDTWVFNTAYAKFRGTASARKNPRDGRPELVAVHPYWCLANHDCNPNVAWDWGGKIALRARERRVVGDAPGGIKAGEEILNHYTDVNMSVKDRREWAMGPLGGWCMCKRCRDESAESASKELNGGSA